jgi:hypothetical protein
MCDSDSRKINRREKILNKNFRKEKCSQEERFLNKSKKQIKKRLEDIKESELWEDWEDYR